MFKKLMDPGHRSSSVSSSRDIKSTVKPWDMERKSDTEKRHEPSPTVTATVRAGQVLGESYTPASGAS